MNNTINLKQKMNSSIDNYSHKLLGYAALLVLQLLLTNMHSKIIEQGFLTGHKKP